MTELIDRQRAITEIESCFCSECYCGKDKSMCGKCEYLYCIDILQQQPTIEAEPVRHGRWNEKGHCECCGYDMGSRVDKWTNVFDFQFCPNCGADMRD